MSKEIDIRAVDKIIFLRARTPPDLDRTRACVNTQIAGNLRQGVRSRSCLSAERRHFSSPRKKHFYFTKSFPNGIIGCVERGFYKKITRSPVSGDQVIRCCSDLMFPPKRDFILKKSLFLDGVHVQMINLFIKKFTHRLSALPQPYCSLSESPLSSLLSPCQPCSCPAA